MKHLKHFFQYVEVSEGDDEQMKIIKAINSDWTHLEGTHRILFSFS